MQPGRSGDKPNPAKFPSPWLAASIVFGMFFGGGYLGIRLARALAPGSDLAEFVSFLALPAAFILGFIGWAGAAGIVAMKRLLQRKAAPSRQPGGVVIPPGSMAFIPPALVAGLAAGTVTGVLSSDTGFASSLLAYGSTGLGYGVACWLLARAGYLPFPTE